MQDFLDDLERRLQAVSADAPARQRSGQTRRRGRRPAVLGGLTALIATAAAAFTMTGTSLADLPILSTDTENAAQLADRAETARAAGVDFSKAHVFGTPGGPGYALVNERTSAMCVVVPDPTAPGTYGQSCERIAAVERDGLRAEVVGDRTRDPNATTLVVFVLPEDASEVRLSVDAKQSTPKVTDGIVVLQLPAAGELSWAVDGRRSSTELQGPFQDAAARITCPDGRQVTVPTPPPGQTTDDSNETIKQLRREHCS